MPDVYNQFSPEHGAAPGSWPRVETAYTRNVVLDLLRKSFPRSGTILALGDTGDFHASFLSAEGFHVVKAGVNPAEPRLYRGHTGGFDRIISAEEHLDCIKDRCIDGILAGKGWLNSFRNIQPALYHAYRVLKENGVYVLLLRNRFSISERLAYIRRRQFRRAFQRARKNSVFIPGDDDRLLSWHHSLRSVKRAARGLFTIQSVVGLNIITPPPSFHHSYRTHPRLIGAAAIVEARIRSFPLLSVLGDHIVIVLERFE